MGQGALPTTLIAGDDGWVIIVMAKQILGKIETRAGEPLRTRQLFLLLNHRRVGPIGNHIGEMRDFVPEGPRVGDGPLVQLGVIFEDKITACREAVYEAGKMATFAPLG